MTDEQLERLLTISLPDFVTHADLEAVCGSHRAPFATGALQKPREFEASRDGSLRFAFGPSTLQPPHRTHHKLWRDSPSSIFIFSRAQPLWRTIHGFFQSLQLGLFCFPVIVCRTPTFLVS